MDGKELISSADLHSFYGQQQQQHHHHHQQQQQQNHHSLQQHHRGLAATSPLAAMHSVIRPMPNMNMTATAILNSIGGGSLAPMHFQMDPTPSPPSTLLQPNTNTNSNTMPPSVAVPPPPADPVVVKRKRGRPRKYGPDGTMKPSAPPPPQPQAQAQHQHLLTQHPRMGSMSAPDMLPLDDPSNKKRRGRPPGTGKKHQPSPSPGNAFSGSAGTSFTPHIITASPSEDVAAKIVAFANQSTRAVCVLSAMGSVSRVVLRHPADASPISRVHASQPYKNPAIYEGFYEVLSLSGSYNLSQSQQSDGLSVTLCSPERNVIGGVLGGALVAATTVQVVLGSFHQGGSRSKSKKAGKQAAAAFSGGDSLTGGGGQEASPSSGHNNQNLTGAGAGGGGWPSAGIFDTRSSNIDINSSRG